MKDLCIPSSNDRLKNGWNRTAKLEGKERNLLLTQRGKERKRGHEMISWTTAFIGWLLFGVYWFGGLYVLNKVFKD